MSEKLTVAELLARNGRKEESADADRPRRRRRSLESGGVSVAELTGSIPVVGDAEASSGSEGAGSQAPSRGAAGRPKAGATAAKQGDRVPDAARTVKPVAERPEEKTSQLSAVQESAKKPGETTFGDVELNSGAKKGSKADGSAAAAPSPSQTDAKNQRRSAPSDIRKVTGVVPPSSSKSKGSAVKAEQADATAGPSKPTVKQGKLSATGTAASGAAATAGASADKDAAQTAVKAAQAPQASRADAPAQTPSRPEADRPVDRGVREAGRPGVASNKGGEAQDTADKPGRLDEPEEFHELEASLGEDEVLEFEDDRISWPAMLGQALAAIAAGVGVFFGFSLLWSNAPGIIVLVLALVVTLVMVGVVHAVLRHSDKLLMLLAFVVGLVLTLGPRFIIGL